MNMTILLYQMLPLLVFIVIDMVVGNTMISILSAILFSAGQMIFTYVQMRKIDYLILVDVALITFLGVISIVLKNEIFFKTKPAIVEAIMVVFFLVLVFSPDSLLISYFSRYMMGKPLHPEMIGIMKKMLVFFTAYIVLHIAAVTYTAFYCSKKMWAFVSGPGFYLVFIPVLVWVLVKRHQNKPVAKTGKRLRS